MPLGILEDHKLEHVPGTAPLNQLGREDQNISGIDASLLKHDASGEIVLVPQPSDSPNANRPAASMVYQRTMEARSNLVFWSTAASSSAMVASMEPS